MITVEDKRQVKNADKETFPLFPFAHKSFPEDRDLQKQLAELKPKS